MDTNSPPYHKEGSPLPTTISKTEKQRSRSSSRSSVPSIFFAFFSCLAWIYIAGRTIGCPFPTDLLAPCSHETQSKYWIFYRNGHKEWINEVNFLGVVNHPNLVKLVGYYAEDDERGIQRLLVYELMCNKSLEDHLLGRVHSPLSWMTHLQIALGAARGLAYLHEEMDFQVVGTIGYAAPEYVHTGRLTSKSDVWSFGVVLYELITGRRAVERNLPTNEQKLLEWVKPFISDSKKFHLLMKPFILGLDLYHFLSPNCCNFWLYSCWCMIYSCCCLGCYWFGCCGLWACCCWWNYSFLSPISKCWNLLKLVYGFFTAAAASFCSSCCFFLQMLCSCCCIFLQLFLLFSDCCWLYGWIKIGNRSDDLFLSQFWSEDLCLMNCNCHCHYKFYRCWGYAIGWGYSGLKIMCSCCCCFTQDLFHLLFGLWSWFAAVKGGCCCCCYRGCYFVLVDGWMILKVVIIKCWCIWFIWSCFFRLFMMQVQRLMRLHIQRFKKSGMKIDEAAYAGMCEGLLSCNCWFSLMQMQVFSPSCF